MEQGLCAHPTESVVNPGFASQQMVLLRSGYDDVITVFIDRFTQSE
jgi:hypothetical protein